MSAFRVPAKWVLAGEHAVLRGAEAVVMPCADFSLELAYEFRDGGGTEIRPPEAGPVVRELLAALDARLGGRVARELTGTLTIRSTIPSGAGLGSSAAVSVALARWLEAEQLLDPRDALETAVRLEDHFHGKSSGMDVAAVWHGEPVAFSMRGGALPLDLARIPRFTLHDTGLRASTRDCVRKVEAAALPEVDRRMAEASAGALSGLRHYSAGRAAQGLQAIAGAMNQAHSCFEAWGLCPQEAKITGESLRSQGALAVKLTGAGGGGFLVALWPD